MATQTKTGRRAAGHKAAATRKRNAAEHSATLTKGSAAQTKDAARDTVRAARTTATRATRTAERHADAATSSVEALVRQAERTVLLIPIGAALEARDAALATVRTYTDRRAVRHELDRFERRGERALGRN